MYLRLLTSVAIHERQDFFEPFVLVRPSLWLSCCHSHARTLNSRTSFEDAGSSCAYSHHVCCMQGLMEMDVQQFRRRCVEPMGEESDHLHIVALTDALQVSCAALTLKCTA